jgi:hypothetical protein
MKYTIVILVLLLNSINASANPMTQEQMEKVVVNKVDVIKQQKGYIVFTFQNVKMALISDVKHDRMRIIAPITNYHELSDNKKNAVMESNFHNALDARYAVSKNILYSAYIHPLSPLTKNQLEGALSQVATLARTFGGSYSSGDLSFSGN